MCATGTVAESGPRTVADSRAGTIPDYCPGTVTTMSGPHLGAMVIITSDRRTVLCTTYTGATRCSDSGTIVIVAIITDRGDSRRAIIVIIAVLNTARTTVMIAVVASETGTTGIAVLRRTVGTPFTALAGTFCAGIVTALSLMTLGVHRGG